MIRAVAIFLVLTLAASAAPVDVPRLLVAIRTVEGYQGRDGAAGERGPWQITAAVWSRHMPGIPFEHARQEGPAHACAVKHIAWLRARLVAAGIDPNPYNLALAWNAGDGAVLRARAPERAYDYAARVRNLYGP